MICKKCDHENFEGDTHCSMCSAKLKLNSGGKPGIGRLFATIASLLFIGVVLVAGIVSIIGGFLGANQENPVVEVGIGEDENHIDDEFIPESLVTESFTSEEIAFMNRMNQMKRSNNRSSIQAIFMTENHVYIAQPDGAVSIYDHQLIYLETIRVSDRRVINLYVTDEAIYFETSFHGFYRYDLASGIRTELSNRRYLVDTSIDGYLVPLHSANSQGEVGIFVHNLQTNAITLLVSGLGFEDYALWDYFNDPVRNRTFLHINGYRLYETMLTDGSMRLITDEATSRIALSPDYLVWIASPETYGFYLYDLETSLTSFIATDFWVAEISVIGNQVLMTDFSQRLYSMELNADDSPLQIAADIATFVVVGNHIIYERTDRYHFNLYTMNRQGNNSRFLSAIVEFSAPMNPVLRDFDSNDLTFINQSNHYAASWFAATPIFLTNDAIYRLAGRSVIRTTDNFDSYETVIDQLSDAWTFNGFHVFDDVVYYTTWVSELGTPVLYRYNRQTSETEQIEIGVYYEVIVDNRVFFRAERLFWGSNLYVLNLDTGQREVVVTGSVSRFIIDNTNNRIIFNDGDFWGANIYQTDLTGENRIVLYEGAREFAFNGELLLINSRYVAGGLHIINLTTGEEVEVPNSGYLLNITFVGNYIIGMSSGRERYLRLIDLDNLHDSWILTGNVSSFLSLGNYILHNQWVGNRYTSRMNLFGQSTQTKVTGW